MSHCQAILAIVLSLLIVLYCSFIISTFEMEQMTLVELSTEFDQ